MSETTKTNGHGGRREGAGAQSPRGGPTVNVSTRILIETRNKLLALSQSSGARSLSSYLGDLLEDLVRREEAKGRKTRTGKG